MSIRLYHKGKIDHKFYKFIDSEHTYKGSLIRHVAIENAIILIAKPTSLRLIHNYKLYRFLRFYCNFLWGLNCNFPSRNVVLFCIKECVV